MTPIPGSRLLALGIGGFWGPERDDDNSHARWIVDADATWSPTSQLLLTGEFLYGGESAVSFGGRGIPIAADAVTDADVHWLGFYALAHYDLMAWLGVSFRYGLFKDNDGARTGVAQVLNSFTITPIVHLSRLIPELRPLGVTYARTRHPIDWVDVRFEYRLTVSDQPVFSDAPPGVPIEQSGNTAHVATVQVVVNY
jgi:Putative beta-barrel porin-2, OmpL-like. bbp2